MTQSRWGLVGVFLGLCLSASLGCGLVHTASSGPEVRSILSPLSVPEAYARAQRAVVQMGGTVVRDDAQAHTFTATLKQGVAVHVHVAPTAEGTELVVATMMLPHQVGFGTLDEADTFLRTYHQGQ